MPHYKTFFDSDYLGSWDLEDLNRDAVGIIAKVQAGKVKNQKGEEDAKLVITFAQTFPRLVNKPLLCNVTNAKAIAGMYGTNTDAWIGKPIGMYVAEVNAFGTVTPSIRVRPTPPKRRAPATQAQQPASLPAPRGGEVHDAELVDENEGGPDGSA